MLRLRTVWLLLAGLSGLFWSAPPATAQEPPGEEVILLPLAGEGQPKENLPVLPAPRMVPKADDPANLPQNLIDLRDLPLVEAMRFLSQQTGVNIVPSADASKVKVSSLLLKNKTPMEAIAALTKAYGLVYRRDAETGIVSIFTTKENQIDLANFREEVTEVFTLLYPNATSAAYAIRDLFGSRVSLGYGVNDQIIYQDLQQRFNRFDLINSRSLGLGVFQNNGTGGVGTGGIGTGGVGVGGIGTGGIGGGGLGGVGVGGGIGGIGGGVGGIGGAGIGLGNFGAGGATQLQNQRRLDTKPDQRLEGLTPEEIQELENAFTNKEAPDRAVLLNLLRRQPATIYITVIKEHNQLLVRTSDQKMMDQIRELVYRMDVPTPVVLLEVKVLSINLKDDFNSIFDFQFTDGILNAGSFTTGNLLPPFADQTPPPGRRFLAINPGPVGTVPSQNFTYQIVSSNFRARMQLLESANRVTELATPLVMTANNEVSRIFTGVTQPITIGFTPSQIVTTGVGTSSTVAGTPVTTLQDIGTSLLITPNINADRTVTLRVLQETSSVNTGGGNIPVVNADGTVTQVAVDTVNVQSCVGTVVAADGMALAMGGLIQEGVSDTRSEIPVLGKIPYVGFFFRRQATERTRTELVVMIRPFVLTTPCESKAVSRTILEAISIHPNVPMGGFGSLGTYTPPEVLRPNPPLTPLQNIFRVQTIVPKDF